MERLEKYMNLDNINCQNLIKYFKENPTYNYKRSFY